MKKTILPFIISFLFIFTACYGGGSDTIPSHHTFSFDTYDELAKWMSADSNEERDNVAWGEKYCNYVSEASKNDTLISIPCYGGAAMKLREKEGFSSISFMTSELYNLPWVWYFCDIDGKEVVVKQACFTQEQISECSGQTATQFIKNIAPGAPNSGNLAQFPAYEEITDGTVTIAEKAVTVVTYVLKNDKRISVQFMLNGSLFMVTAEKEVLNKDFWSLFSVAPISEAQT